MSSPQVMVRYHLGGNLFKFVKSDIKSDIMFQNLYKQKNLRYYPRSLKQIESIMSFNFFPYIESKFEFNFSTYYSSLFIY